MSIVDEIRLDAVRIRTAERNKAAWHAPKLRATLDTLQEISTASLPHGYAGQVAQARALIAVAHEAAEMLAKTEEEA